MNIFSLSSASYELAPNHILRRATVEETKLIKDTITRLPSGRGGERTYFWEHRWPHHGGPIERLPADEWRYHVIAFSGTNAILHSLEQAFDLSPVELEIGFTVFREQGLGYLWHGGRLFHVMDEASTKQDFFIRPSPDDLAFSSNLRVSIDSYDKSLLDLFPSINQMCQLKAMQHGSPLRFLGYFAVLESLLTHAPKPLDPYDSITRQVKKKLSLLDNRWTPKLDYSSFGGTDPEKIWQKMYIYRSMLAHGGSAEFSGDLASLRNHETALSLVINASKALIRFAMQEPRLILDLRNC